MGRRPMHHIGVLGGVLGGALGGALGRMGGAIALAALCLAAPAVLGQGLNTELPEDVRGLDIIEHPGDLVPMDVRLVDDRGRDVVLGDLFDGEKPVVVVMAYYDCPMLCGLVLGGLAESFNDLSYTIGSDFTTLVVSFDPTNTTEQAARHKQDFFLAYDRPADEDGFVCTTAAEGESKRLADALGFPYRYLPESDEYAHPAAVFVLTPEGRISRYMYGVSYPPKQMKLALLEASRGKIAKGVADRVLMFCYHFDPSAGAYTMQASKLMRLGAAVTVTFLGGMIGLLVLGERRRARRRGARGAPVKAGRVAGRVP